MEQKDSYIGQEFIDGQILNASHLNTMSNGIITNETNIKKLKDNIDNLNTEISSINTDIEEVQAIGDLLSFRGDIPLFSYKDPNKGQIIGIVDLPFCEKYSIYRIIDSESNIKDFNIYYNLNISNQDYMICEQSFSSKRFTKQEFLDVWAQKPTLSNYADEGSPGLVSTLNQSFSGNKTFLNNVTIEGNTLLNSNKIYHKNEEVILPKKGQLEELNETLNLRIENVEVDQELLAEKLGNNIDSTIYLKDKIDNHSNQIKTLTEDQSSTSSLVAANIKNIETNKINIEANKNNIDENSKLINANANNIENNTKNIKINSSNIASIFNEYSQIIPITKQKFGPMIEKAFYIQKGLPIPEELMDVEDISFFKFYFVVESMSDTVPESLYIGNFKIAQQGTGGTGTSNGFPYTFPIIF